ncbi:MAG TPA: hypothetical protein VN962_23935 [Polyangia bacterium]|nr:hypothetical protein [Polyangia bacterium]
MSAEPDGKNKGNEEQPSRLGKFIQTYSAFLSSFVIGVAGLVATSIWQYRQSQISAQQAKSEQVIAQTKAENDWRIARAEILSKNLNVLSGQGPGSADQKFGVLLSLTRGAIIDPELAVSYAMELGKQNPTYMRTVLEATAQKNYEQMSQGFKLTCVQRYGVQKATDVCKDDALAERSDAIAQVIQDEMDTTASAHAPPETGPMVLLREERDVQAHPAKMSWLFTPYLQDLYDRRQWQDIQKFESFSTGARLVGALVLATARTGEMVSSTEASQLEQFHAGHRHWLASYLLGGSCESECRGKLADVMLSSYGQANGDYDEAFRRVLLASHNEATPAYAHLHARLLWCQLDDQDVARFRDGVVVPGLEAALANSKTAPTLLEDLVGLTALLPEPAITDANATAAWKKLQADVAKAPDHLQRTYNVRRAAAVRERQNPPAVIRKVNFCNVPTVTADSPDSTTQMPASRNPQPQ